jgi:hypothetical protein
MAIQLCRSASTLGDDYPAVLHQMKDQLRRARIRRMDGGHYILFYDQFAAQGATLHRVAKIFAEADIAMVCLSDVDTKKTE